ncbi:MAG: hypothetical protein HQM10_15150 [Candidatus Riflebacteria bacterium]|nr:hypothetical protein [Candidatus Riflebacteria bacterium]
MKKYIFLIFSFLATSSLSAGNNFSSIESFSENRPFLIAQLSDADMEKAKNELKSLMKDVKTDTPEESSGNPTFSEGNPAPPNKENNVVDSSPEPGDTGKDESDDPISKRFCEGHLKIAKRRFKEGNLKDVEKELDIIFERIPDFQSGRFLKAIVCAKTKDFMGAWRNIEIVSKKSPDNPKVKEFIAKLEKVSPKPSVIADEVKKLPEAQFASELLCNAVDTILSDKTLGKNISRISSDEPEEVSGKVNFTVTFFSQSSIDSSAVEKKIAELNGLKVESASPASEGKELKLKVLAENLPRNNPTANSITDITQFVEEIRNNNDIKINENSESNPDSEGNITSTYSIIAPDCSKVVQFLRAASTHSLEYLISNLESSVFNQKSVWKGSIKIKFKGSKK